MKVRDYLLAIIRDSDVYGDLLDEETEDTLAHDLETAIANWPPKEEIETSAE